MAKCSFLNVLYNLDEKAIENHKKYNLGKGKISNKLILTLLFGPHSFWVEKNEVQTEHKKLVKMHF